MTAKANVQALLFDVFGTVVDWRGSIIAELTRFGAEKGLARRLGRLHRRLARPLSAGHGGGAIGPAGVDHPRCPASREPGEAARQVRHHQPERGREGSRQPRLASPEAVARRRRKVCSASRSRYIIGTLSNGNVGLLTRMAKNAGLPWDVVLGAETARAYKPLPAAYLASAALLNLEPAQVMLVAAHNGDLAAAASAGLRTAFVARPSEYGPHQKLDFKADRDWDVVTDSFTGVADAMGC